MDKNIEFLTDKEAADILKELLDAHTKTYRSTTATISTDAGRWLSVQLALSRAIELLEGKE